MTRNVGGAERTARIILGALLIAVPIVVAFPGYWDAVPFALGAMLLATGLFRYCPINRLLGRDTAHRTS